VIAYRTALLTYLLSRLLVRVEHIGMVNIIAGKTVCPEFVQDEATPAALANALVPLVEDTPERARMCDGLDGVIQQLGHGGAEQRAAAIVLEEIGIGRQEA
jgi:lipid-A-disaccharide synthase